MDREKTIDEVLVRGLDDWVMLTEVEFVVRRATPGAGPDQLVAESVDLIEAMLGDGLVEVGEVREDAGGFVRWTLAPTEAAARITSEWRNLGRDLNLGDVCWLSNTAAGDERARQVSGD